MPETATALPPTEEQLEQEETKFTLRRTPGLTPVLPVAGTRRFNRTYMQEAMRLDTSYDGFPAQNQGPWDEDAGDVFSHDTWERWAR